MIEKINSAISPLERDQKINEIIDKLPSVGHNLFDIKWSDHLLNDQSWLLSNGSWCSGTTYSECYQHLVDDIDDITAETETIAGYTVTFYRATDGHKICLAAQETTVSDIYTATGIAWYYVLDTTNTRFKFPRSEWGFVGYRDGVGDYVEAGLPNITGEAKVNFISNTGVLALASPVEAFKTEVGTGGSNYYPTVSSSSGSPARIFSFDASRSSSIYGNSTSVQPPATQMYLYFYVGEFSQTATEQTAGLNAELFNGKADTDLSNITPAQSAKNTIINWGMPDYDNQISLSGSITQYTPPTDGYMHIYGYVTQNKHFMLGLSSPITDAAAIAGFATTSNIGAAYGGYYVPVAGNRTYYIDNDGIVLGFYFVPCKGAN